MASVNIQSARQNVTRRAGLFHPLVSQLQSIAEGCASERAGGSERHGAGHVGDAVVDHSIHHERGLVVGGRLARLNATTLVDGHVHDHRAFLHHGKLRTRHEPRRTRTGQQHRAHE